MTDTSAAERYVAGRMNDAELAAFEALLIERADLAADVAVRQRIKLGLETLDGRGELQPLLKKSPGTSGMRRYAMAASAVLVLVAAGVFLAQRETGFGTQGNLFAAKDAVPDLRVLSSLRLAVTRSNSPPQRIALSASDGLVHLQLIVDSATPSEVSVALATGPAEQPKRMGDVHATRQGNGVVDVWMRTAGLTEGVYRLTVMPLAGDGVEQSFEFEIGPG